VYLVPHCQSVDEQVATIPVHILSAMFLFCWTALREPFREYDANVIPEQWIIEEQIKNLMSFKNIEQTNQLSLAKVTRGRVVSHAFQTISGRLR
jgi:hypothetical protein